MTMLMTNELGGDSQRSRFMTLPDESSYGSYCSWDEDTDSDEDSSSYFSEDDDSLDAQMKDGFILEKPLNLHELDRMLDWGIGGKANETPPEFNKSVLDSAMMLPKRRGSMVDDRCFLSKGTFRSSGFGSSNDLVSFISNEFNSNMLDLDDSDDDVEFDSNRQTRYRSRQSFTSKQSFTSMLGFECEDERDPSTSPSSSNDPHDQATLLRHVRSFTSLVDDEDTSIADSGYVTMGASSALLDADRWTENRNEENKRLSETSRASRWNEGLPQEKRTSSGTSQEQPARRSVEGATMPPPRRRLSNVGNWRISKRHSLTTSNINFEMFNHQIHAEVGLRMTDSLPAQKIMEAIMSVLQSQEEESKQEEMRPQQRIIEGTHRRGSMPRVQ